MRWLCLAFACPWGFTTTTRATERYYDIKQMEEAIDELRGLSKEASIKIDTQFDNDLKQAETIISRYRDRIDQEEARALGRLEKLEGKTLGDKNDPLLISVRSGGAKSMPGMMDTVLNLGLWGEAVNGFGKQEGGELFAFDTYRRFLNMFGSIVLGIPKEEYNDIMTAKKKSLLPGRGLI